MQGAENNSLSCHNFSPIDVFFPLIIKWISQTPWHINKKWTGASHVWSLQMSMIWTFECNYLPIRGRSLFKYIKHNTISSQVCGIRILHWLGFQGCQLQIHWKIFSAKRKMRPLLISTFSSAEHLLAGDLLWTSFFLFLLKVSFFFSFFYFNSTSRRIPHLLCPGQFS